MNDQINTIRDEKRKIPTGANETQKVIRTYLKPI